MYVCVCIGVTESAVRAAASAGARDFDALTARTGCGSGCGCCRELASNLLAQHAVATNAPVSRTALSGDNSVQ